MSAPENPQAFPSETDPNGKGFQSGSQLWTHPGMSLRDWFAGQALAGICSTLTGGGHFKIELIASDAFEIADALLAERQKAGQS